MKKSRFGRDHSLNGVEVSYKSILYGVTFYIRFAILLLFFLYIFFFQGPETYFMLQHEGLNLYHRIQHEVLHLYYKIQHEVLHSYYSMKVYTYIRRYSMKFYTHITAWRFTLILQHEGVHYYYKIQHKVDIYIYILQHDTLRRTSAVPTGLLTNRALIREVIKPWGLPWVVTGNDLYCIFGHSVPRKHTL